VLTQTYLMAGRYMQKRIMQDTYDLKRQLKQRDIRYEEDQNDDFVMYFMIYYRGYQERFGMTRDVMKTEISLKLTQYSSEFGEILKNTK
jgi:hypothetical protein